MRRRRFLGGLVAASLVLGARGSRAHFPLKGLVVEHLPRAYLPRSGEITANVCGHLPSGGVLEYSLNDGTWHSWRSPEPASPRTPPGRFTLELPAESLREGLNRLTVRSDGTEFVREFSYAAAPGPPPKPVRWEDPGLLDVQDGSWECCSTALGPSVRPVPGTEDYDRLVLASGSFRGARRVSGALTFRSAPIPGRPFGFGLIPLWAGHREDEAVRPRRGWRFGIAWYYSNWSGFGVEGSDKLGGVRSQSVDVRSACEVAPGQTWRLVSEAWPTGAGWRLWMRYERLDVPHAGAEVALEVPDRLLPAGEACSVALVAHRAQVEFGPVTIESLA